MDYLIAQEWAVQADDILWRRTKLGLFTSPAEKQALADYLHRAHSNRAAEQAA